MKKFYQKWWFWVIVGMLVLGLIGEIMGKTETKETNNTTNNITNKIENTQKESKREEEPDEIELMSYAQTVLKDNLTNPTYSRNKKDYKFINTGLRYKIEGKVNNENFYMIIEFVDDTYKEYDLISLQVGNEKVY